MSGIRILYLGDIMGAPGRAVVAAKLPGLRRKFKIDVVIAQAENVSHGKSMTPGHMRELQQAGVDFFSGGNHTIERQGLFSFLDDPLEPVIAPINQPGVQPSWGAKKLATKLGDILVVSLLGTTFPELDQPIGNPLKTIDAVLKAATGKQEFAAIVVNFHGDYSSEKRVAGFYLDGRVSAVVGDHWHVPTADAMVLPGGTAHITDVGMCGTLLTSLGVSKEIIVARWRDGAKNKNDIAEGGPYQLNGVVIETKNDGLARSITPINLVIEKLG